MGAPPLKMQKLPKIRKTNVLHTVQCRIQCFLRTIIHTISVGKLGIYLRSEHSLFLQCLESISHMLPRSWIKFKKLVHPCQHECVPYKTMLIFLFGKSVQKGG